MALIAHSQPQMTVFIKRIETGYDSDKIKSTTVISLPYTNLYTLSCT
jgi:hypothetical protein